MRPFTRLSNGFSKKAESLAALSAIHFKYCKLARAHKSLVPKTSPAMAVGIADLLWTK